MPTSQMAGFARALGSATLVLSLTTAALQSTAAALHLCPISAADQALDTEEQNLLILVNQYRVANGRNPLSLSERATRAAAWFSRDMATRNYAPADHVDSNGSTIEQRLSACIVNFNQYAENIFWGSPDARAAFDLWRGSPIHNPNMLLPGVTHAGIGRAFDASSTYGWYWVLDLTAGESPPPPATVAGAGFYTDGTSARSGPSGARVSVFATSAEPGFRYKLVSGRSSGAAGRPCSTDVVPVNDAAKFANAQGVIGQTAGTLVRPAGEWQICFLAEGQAVTGAATYTVTG